MHICSLCQQGLMVLETAMMDSDWLLYVLPGL